MIAPGRSSRVIVAKGQTHFDGFDEKIISLYARGLTVREIQGHLAEIYGTEVSPDLISRVTDAVLDEVREWQSRPLEPIYPIVFFDALRVKIRDEGLVKNKAVYVALGTQTADGEKEVLGLWIEQTEGAKFWLKVMNDLKTRGIADILIAVVDGLKGFPEAIASVFPQTLVQTCIVHLIRNSLAFVSWKDRKAIMPALKAIYHAENADAACARLEEFEAEWGKRYPGDRPGLAACLGARRSVLRLRAGDPQNDLHDKRRRGAEPIFAQDHQDTRQLSHRRSGDEAALSRHQERRRTLATTHCMDCRYGPICNPVRRPFRALSELRAQTKGDATRPYTEIQTLPTSRADTL